jgi:hypothetical protein
MYLIGMEENGRETQIRGEAAGFLNVVQLGWAQTFPIRLRV